MTTATATKARKTTRRTHGPAKTGNPQTDREANAAALRAANARGETPSEAKAPATDVNAKNEAEVLNGVRDSDKPGPAKATPRKTASKGKATVKPKADPKPAAKPGPKPMSEKEKLLRPASKTVSAYVTWLKGKLGKETWDELAQDPVRFAEVSLQNYGAFQASKRS